MVSNTELPPIAHSCPDKYQSGEDYPTGVRDNIRSTFSDGWLIMVLKNVPLGSFGYADQYRELWTLSHIYWSY